MAHLGDEATLTDDDGVQLFYRSWPAANRPRGAVVIVHGASEHSGRYGRFASELTAAGWTVLAPDLRGHGRTADSTGPGLVGPGGFDALYDDLDRVVQLAASAADGGPVVLFGHSMGSVFALRYAETRSPDLAALVLSGPLGVSDTADATVAALREAVDAGHGDVAMDALTGFNAEFEPARTPFDWLSRDEAEVDAYLADPMCGSGMPLTHGYALEVFTAVRDGAAEAGRLPAALPVLLVAGERDPVSAGTVQARALARRLEQAGLRVDQRYYPDARHELLNETNRAEVQGDLLRWLAGIAG